MPAIWASRRLAQAGSSRHFCALLRWIRCCTSVHISVPLDSSVLHLFLIRSHPFSSVLIRSHLFLHMHVHPIHLFTSVLIARGVLEHRGTPLPTCPPPLGDAESLPTFFCTAASWPSTRPTFLSSFSTALASAALPEWLSDVPGDIAALFEELAMLQEHEGGRSCWSTTCWPPPPRASRGPRRSTRTPTRDPTDRWRWLSTSPSPAPTTCTASPSAPPR